jgi:hypothetical protein
VTLSRSFQVYLEGFFVWEQDPWFMTYWHTFVKGMFYDILLALL